MAPHRNKKGKAKAEPSAAAEASPSPSESILKDYVPEPIATVNFRDYGKLAESYKGCVEKIIKAMKDDDTSPNFTFFDADGEEIACIPLTPGKDNTPSGVYTIALEDEEKRLIVVVEKYQNWFRGIVTADGQRFEIDELETKMMEGSMSLHNSARYFDLLGNTVDQCKIGFQPLIDSFNNLAGHSAKSNQKKAHVAVAVLLVMLFEAPRFPAVLKRCKDLLERMDEGTVGELLQKEINNWGDTSYDFYDANGEQRTVNVTEQTKAPIKKAATGLTMLCRSRWDKWLENKEQNEPKPSANRRQMPPRIHSREKKTQTEGTSKK